ncbi:MAG: glycosyltransferase family 39 protein [Caldilineaceae bacterium]|nr:glycosyltransferase family 39 protein [Caldilineaceae bacterium]
MRTAILPVGSVAIAETQRAERTKVRGVTWLTLTAAALLFVGHSWLYRAFIIDDAYITFRFVQQWVNGNGLVFNIGERVEGYSNFLWIVLLAPFAWFDVDLVTAAKILGVTCSIITIFVTWRFALHAGLLGIASLLLAATAPFAVWSMGGLETPLVTCLVMISAYVFVREEETERGAWSGFWLALLALTRPEALLFAGIAVLLRLWMLWQQRRWPARRDWLRAALLVAIVGLYFLWRWSYYGYLLPNTVYAKSMGGHPRAWIEGFYYLYSSLTAVGGFAWVALPVSLLLAQTRLGIAERYWLSASAALALFMVVSGGDWMPLNRFAVHGLPLIFLAIEAGLIRLSMIWNRRWLLPLVVTGQIAFFLFQSAETLFVDNILARQPATGFAPTVALLATQTWQPGDSIAVVDAGYLPYNLPLEVRVIDMVGLTDSHIAHLPAQFPGGLFGRGDGFGKWDVAYVLAQNPRFVQAPVLSRGADGSVVTIFTGATRLLNHPDFQARYRELSVSGLFERID